MIKIKKSSTADTRTCDWSKVTKDELLEASANHINDVRRAIWFLAAEMAKQCVDHDFTKIEEIEQFHSDFSTGFKTTTWWDNHRKQERHHLSHDDGVRDDVNLIDVLEYIADCVMAGKARSGTVNPLVIKTEVLVKAFDNTWKMLEAKVQVIES
jgi:hypothetical protein